MTNHHYHHMQLPTTDPELGYASQSPYPTFKAQNHPPSYQSVVPNLPRANQTVQDDEQVLLAQFKRQAATPAYRATKEKKEKEERRKFCCRVILITAVVIVIAVLTGTLLHVTLRK